LLVNCQPDRRISAETASDGNDPAAPQDQGRRTNGRDRAGQIAEHVQPCTALIERGRTTQRQKGAEIGGRADHRRRQHHRAIDRRRPEQSVRSRNDHRHRQGQQHQAVGIGGERLVAAMPVGAVGPRRALRHADGDDRQQQGGGVGQHVCRLGIQRYRVGPQATAGFDQCEAEQQTQGHPQAPLAGLIRAMDMPRRMRVTLDMAVIMVMTRAGGGAMVMSVGMLVHKRLSYRNEHLPRYRSRRAA
jgi:hypothetical protein